MDNRTINDEYAEIAQDLINSEEALASLRDCHATIVYLSSSHAKKGKDKIVYGECEKISEKYKWGLPADFTITVYEPNVALFTEEQIRILLFHELLHVGIEYKEDGSESYFVRNHDYEDFKLIIDRFGTDWCKTSDDDGLGDLNMFGEEE